MSDMVGFAVIGAGNIGKIHLDAISNVDNARAVVVCDRYEEGGRSAADAYGTEWVADYREAVVRDDVDVVAVCTPTGTHMEIAEAAAAAGKHLFVEKPLDVNLNRADRIIQVADDADVKLACIFPRRFSAGVRLAREAIQAGRLGRLTLADVSVKWYRPQSYYGGSDNWRGTWRLDGGGALMNQSIHYIDLLQWLVGPVDQVYAHTATLAHEMEAEDTAVALLKFAGGALGTVQGSTSCWPGEPARIAIHGDRGSIELEENQIVQWKLADAGPDEEAAMLNLEAASGSGAADPTAIGSEMHQRQVEDLIEAILTDRPPFIAGIEGRNAIEIIRAIYRSAETGRSISLPFDG